MFSLYSSPVIINGVDINEFQHTSGFINFRQKIKKDFITLSFSNRRLNIGSFNKYDRKKERLVFDKITKCRYLGSGMSEENYLCLLTDYKYLTYHTAFLVGNCILLGSNNCLKISYSILQAKDTVLLSSNECCFEHCYISDAEKLQIDSNNVNSLIKIIVIKFSKKTPYALVSGTIDFSQNLVTKKFKIYGATEINILFDEAAYN